MEKRIPAAASPQLPQIEHIDAQAIRIDLERLSDRLCVLLRPRLVSTAGPRVAIELSGLSARDLGTALLRHADALEVPHG